jgi:hypothetical protein
MTPEFTCVDHIATVAIGLQVLFNLEAIRYTLSHVGTVFPATPGNLAHWREWLRSPTNVSIRRDGYAAGSASTCRRHRPASIARTMRSARRGPFTEPCKWDPPS